MKWFKFYGQDFLTDPKILSMDTLDRFLWVVLLCMASSENKGGLIKNCSDEIVIKLAGIEIDVYDHGDGRTYYERAQGFLRRVNDNGMITLSDNGDVTILAFQKRQGSNLTGYERVKRYREKHSRLAVESDDNANDNVNDNEDDNVRIDKNRIDKRDSKDIESSPTSRFRVVEDGPSKKKEPKNKVALRLQSEFISMAEKKIGTRPVRDGKGYFIVVSALRNLDEKQILDLFSEWFDLGRPDEEAVSITRALSARQIEQYKVRNQIK